MNVLQKRSWLGRRQVRRINLALQGGGGLGAFVWGVLDRLADDPRIEIEGISGTSSGAINAALFADGLAADGAPGARRSLETFWRKISDACEARRRPWFSIRRQLRERRLQLSSLNVFHDLMQRLMVPYEFDARTMEPLRSAIAQSIDFARLNASAKPLLFINATDINAVRMRVFSRPEITLDALCASSCLPFLFHPVEIDGTHYWDGGFMGNPAITPLVYGCKSPDIVLIETEPPGRRATPKTAAGLIERMSEISFTATLAREIETIALHEGAGAEALKRRPRMPKTYLHRIAPVSDLEAEGGRGYSKFNAEWRYLQRLKELGHQAAERWLKENFDSLGQTTTIDLQDRFE